MELVFNFLLLFSICYFFFRYHLQALRHLYVLAAEPRLIIPKDVKSGTMVGN